MHGGGEAEKISNRIKSKHQAANNAAFKKKGIDAVKMPDSHKIWQNWSKKNPYFSCFFCTDCTGKSLISTISKLSNMGSLAETQGSGLNFGAGDLHPWPHFIYQVPNRSGDPFWPYSVLILPALSTNISPSQANQTAEFAAPKKGWFRRVKAVFLIQNNCRVHHQLDSWFESNNGAWYHCHTNPTVELARDILFVSNGKQHRAFTHRFVAALSPPTTAVAGNEVDAEVRDECWRVAEARATVATTGSTSTWLLLLRRFLVGEKLPASRQRQFYSCAKCTSSVGVSGCFSGKGFFGFSSS